MSDKEDHSKISGMNEVERVHRDMAAVFTNATGQRAIRIPDLTMAICTRAQCRVRSYGESPQELKFCQGCGQTSLRFEKDWGQMQPFWVSEPTGGHRVVNLVQVSDETDPDATRITRNPLLAEKLLPPEDK